MNVKRGFFLIDITIGLAVIVALALTLALVSGQERRALQRMEQRRTAQRVAEDVLSDLQTGHAAAARPNIETQVSLVPGDPPAAGYVWCKVQVIDNGQQAALIGLVPAKAVPQ